MVALCLAHWTNSRSNRATPILPIPQTPTFRGLAIQRAISIEVSSPNEPRPRRRARRAIAVLQDKPAPPHARARQEGSLDALTPFVGRPAPAVHVGSVYLTPMAAACPMLRHSCVETTVDHRATAIHDQNVNMHSEMGRYPYRHRRCRDHGAARGSQSVRQAEADRERPADWAYRHDPVALHGSKASSFQHRIRYPPPGAHKLRNGGVVRDHPYLC